MTKFYQLKHSWYNCGYVVREDEDYIYIRHPLTGEESVIWIPAIDAMYRELSMEEVAKLHLTWP